MSEELHASEEMTGIQKAVDTGIKELRDISHLLKVQDMFSLKSLLKCC